MIRASLWINKNTEFYKNSSKAIHISSVLFWTKVKPTYYSVLFNDLRQQQLSDSTIEQRCLTVLSSSVDIVGKVPMRLETNSCGTLLIGMTKPSL